MGPIAPLCGGAYTAWATHYDEFMKHPDYPLWVRRLEALTHRLRPCGGWALDVGCGTGKSTEPLLELGYSVTGVDSSPLMLEQAAAKLGGQVRLIEAALPDLPSLGEFDYVSCLNDVLNYLLDTETLEAAFQALREHMAPGAVLVFDTSTQALYRGCYAQTRWRELSGAGVLWHGQTPVDFQPGGIAEATVEVFTRDNESWRREGDRHIQRHFPEAEVARALARAGLQLEAVYGQFDDGRPVQPLDEERHTKAVHVATRLP